MRPEFMKAAGMIQMMTQGGGISAQKLNLMLFLADVAQYLQCDRTISGQRYVHLGAPVPEGIQPILGELLDEALVVKTEVEHPDGRRIDYRASRTLPPEAHAAEYAPAEREVIEQVRQVLSPLAEEFLLGALHSSQWWQDQAALEPIDLDDIKRDQPFAAWLGARRLFMDLDRLVNRYPRLLRRRTHSPFSQRGFECASGWFVILDRLFAGIEAHCAAMALPDAQYPAVQQAKEKFGTLAVHLRFGPSARIRYGDVADLLHQAEKASASTCEWCARPGVLRRQGWWRVTCAGCERAEP